MFKTNKVGNLSVFILFLSLLFVMALSLNSVSAANGTVLKNNTTVPSEKVSLNSVSAANGTVLKNNTTVPSENNSLTSNFEGQSSSAFKIDITEINGKTWSGGDIYLHPGDKLQVEAKLSVEDWYNILLGWYDWLPGGWRYLNFYLASSYNGGVVWKEEGVFTNLFTGKTSVTIDTKGLNLNQPTYQLCAYYSCTPETIDSIRTNNPPYQTPVYGWVTKGYAYTYTPVKMDILPPNSGSNPPGNNSSNNNSSGNNSSTENTIINTSEPLSVTTVPMQNTGAPLIPLAIGALSMLAGLASIRRK
jgi:hypothetical protein